MLRYVLTEELVVSRDQGAKQSSLNCGDNSCGGLTLTRTQTGI